MITLQQLGLRTVVPTVLFFIFNYLHFLKGTSSKRKFWGIIFTLISSYTVFYGIARNLTYGLFLLLQNPFPSLNSSGAMALESLPIYIILYCAFTALYVKTVAVKDLDGRFIQPGYGFFLYTQYLVMNYVSFASALSERELILHQLIICIFWYFVFCKELPLMRYIYPKKKLSAENSCLTFEYLFVLAFWISPVVISNDLTGYRINYVTLMFGVLSVLLFAFCLVIQKVMFQDAYHEFREIQTLSADSLTGLTTRSVFLSKTQEILNVQQFEDSTTPVAIFINIAEFKYFNQLHGQYEADELLKEIATKLRELFGLQAGISRLADDHFAVITLESEYVEHNILTLHQDLNKKYGRVNLKAGVYHLHSDDKDISNVIDKAKSACDSIKNEHNLILKHFDEANARAMFLEHYVVENVERAIEKNMLTVFYQPITDVSTGKLMSCEALARWFDVDQGALSPAEFIPVLERHNLTYLVDLFVVERVCKDLRKQADDNMPLYPVAVNLSRKDFFLEDDIIESVNKIVDQYNIDRQFIKIEITESAFTEDNEHIRECIRRFHNLGYRVWMDDFGSGYSSLNMLGTFDFDGIKLDMVFLQNLSERGKYIISSIVKATKSMGLTVLMEGVETQEHYDFIKEIGCDHAQGYFLGKPGPRGSKEELEEFMKTSSLF